MASVFSRRSSTPPRVWGILMDYWQVPASLAVTWWRALGRSHHARALAVPRSQATAIEEAVLRNVDREGEWR